MTAAARVLLVGALAALLLPAARAQTALEAIAASGASAPAPWHVVGLPQQTKPFTRFSVVDVDGRRAVRIEADSSYGNLVHPLKLAAPATLAWQWRIERPLEAADLTQQRGDDTAVKVCVFFDEPMDNVPFAERQLLRMARSRTSELVPTATVCYVWDAHLPAGTILDNTYTRRVRYLVLQSGSDRLDRWVEEKRDLGADFKRLFGAETPGVPQIVGVAVGADGDNTKSRSVSYVAGLVLSP